MKNTFPATDSLKELQDYIWQMNIERGFSQEAPSEKLLMVMEEVGELAKAIRQHIGMKFSDTTKKAELEEELADVQILLLGLASLTQVDMFEAVRAKEAKNNLRIWK